MSGGFTFRPNKTGVIVQGVNDQYADGKMADSYQDFIGNTDLRTENYKRFLLNIFRKNGCKRILDVACGTGIDSIMLLEEGFDVVSTDGSDKMLKYALQTRWERRNEPAFDKWTILEANWLDVYERVQHLVGDGFDAVICFGSSFAHMLDRHGDQRDHINAIRNFEKCIKPGGLLLIDHRNYEQLINTGSAPKNCIYYDSKCMTDVATSVLYVRGNPALIIRDYTLEKSESEDDKVELRLLFYPHSVPGFKRILRKVFGENAQITVFGDFLPLDEVKEPLFYIHMVEKGNDRF